MKGSCFAKQIGNGFVFTVYSPCASTLLILTIGD